MVGRRIGAGVAAAVLLSQVVAVVVILASGGTTVSLGLWAFRVRDLPRALATGFIAAAALVMLLSRARAWVRGVPASAAAFYAAALLVAFWLSLGPALFSHGQRIGGGSPYAWLYAHVPGFDGLRVPARMGMLVALFLAVLGGYGVAALERAWPRRGSALAATAGALFLVEATAAPIGINGTWPVEGTVSPPVPLFAESGPPSIYRAVRQLPATTVLAEFPFGEEQFDLRYMVWSASHWRPLLNGYSGGFPASYAVNRAALGRLLDDPGRAWAVLSRSGATHAIVHESLYLEGRGSRVSRWLESHGATAVAEANGDRIFKLPGATSLGG
jgi:hypothetical protein